ncbi:hypothetical protein PMZ80_006350 [Knufia obscura]|uniref:AA9 family lytic polysaccharide monooxygenase n=2 Tax=Knufia TaxID=430999 RepID=A0AAN8EQ06_9EURO|nr:hypothetical protein PMZ80_006350 [Knufia obscura]KAK5953505.1 hypothetical protein OHC33_005449 [Knufia fluminis]
MHPLIITSVLLTGAHLASGHTRFTTLHVNGKSQGDGICIRQDSNPGTTTNYVPSITGPEMACGIGGDITVPDTCPVVAGDQISLEHRMWPDGSQPGAIDVSHKGNTAVYMKKVSSNADEVTGNGWFKIYWDGYDAATGLWRTDSMNANDGLVTTSIPSVLAAGEYLVRSEVLALQNVGEPQMYIGCAQVQVSGSGTATPSNTVAIPGYIDMSTPAMQVNIYESFTFEEDGPVKYGSGGSNSPSNSTAPVSSSESATPASSAEQATTAASAVAATKTSVAASTVSNTYGNDPSAAGSTGESWAGESASEDSLMDKNEDSDSDVDDGNSNDGEYANKYQWSSWGRWNNGRTRSRRSVAAMVKRQ